MNNVSDNSLQIGWDLQIRINQLDAFLSSTIIHPEWFVDVMKTRTWLESEIAQLECEQIAELENEKSLLAGKLEVKRSGNLIIPSIWDRDGNGKEVFK
jgi:hypothetical protein